MRGEGRAESAGRVHGGAGEWADDEDAESHGEADTEARDGAEGAAVVDRGGEKDQDEEERSDGFQDHGGESGEVAKKRWGAESYGVPGFVGDDGSKQERSRDAAEHLRGPVEEGIEGANAFGDPEADGDGGIEVSARDVAKCGNHDGHRET